MTAPYIDRQPWGDNMCISLPICRVNSTSLVLISYLLCQFHIPSVNFTSLLSNSHSQYQFHIISVNFSLLVSISHLYRQFYILAANFLIFQISILNFTSFVSISPTSHLHTALCPTHVFSGINCFHLELTSWLLPSQIICLLRSQL